MNKKEKKKWQLKFLNDFDTEDSDNKDLFNLYNFFIYYTIAFLQVCSSSVTLFITLFITLFTTFFHSQFSTSTVHIKLQQQQQRFIKYLR